jgi:hypothetical protein
MCQLSENDARVIAQALEAEVKRFLTDVQAA